MMKVRNIAMRACLPWIYTGGTSSRSASYRGVLADTDGGSNMENMREGIPVGMIVTRFPSMPCPLRMPRQPMGAELTCSIRTDRLWQP